MTPGRGKLKLVASDCCDRLLEDKVVAVEEEEEREDDGLLFFLQPPPTGTFLREPPLVQYLLHPLQKYLGWERL